MAPFGDFIRETKSATGKLLAQMLKPFVSGDGGRQWACFQYHKYPINGSIHNNWVWHLSIHVRIIRYALG